MPRIRCLRPEVWGNETNSEITPTELLLFLAIKNICDRNGRVDDKPRQFKNNLFGFWDDFTWQDIDEMLTHLAAARRIERYEIKGRKLIQILGWHDPRSDVYERPHEKEPGLLMAPEGYKVPSAEDFPRLPGMDEGQKSPGHPPGAKPGQGPGRTPGHSLLSMNRSMNKRGKEQQAPKTKPKTKAQELSDAANRIIRAHYDALKADKKKYTSGPQDSAALKRLLKHQPAVGEAPTEKEIIEVILPRFRADEWIATQNWALWLLEKHLGRFREPVKQGGQHLPAEARRTGYGSSKDPEAERRLAAAREKS